MWLTDEQTARNGLLDVQIFTATLLSIKYYSVSSCYSDDLMIMTTRITGKVGGGVIGYLRRSHGRNQHIQEARRAFSYCISSLFIFHTLLYFILTFNLCQVSSLFPVEWPISWEGLKSGGNPQKSAFQIPPDKREYNYFVQSWFRKKNETNQFVEGGIPLPIGFLQWQGAIYLLLKIVLIYLCRIPILNEQQYFIFYIFLSENVIVLFQT